MKKTILCYLILGLLFVNCSKDDGILEPGGPEPDPNSEVNIQAQNFIWKALNLWYFWQQDVPNLADDRFSNSKDYTEFLQSEEDPGEFFKTKLRFNEDRFTFYRSDYRELINSLSGNVGSNGLEFGLSQFFESDEVFGYVEYILPNTDAASKDVKRGDIFIGVDGQRLNLGNYIELLFGTNTTYTLNMADLTDDNRIVPNNKEVQLSKSIIQVDPIYLEKIIEINGKKIGYLMYNRFLDDFDGQLNEVFQRFESAGISDLILDFRYNPGGRVTSAQRIASMVYDNDPTILFSTSVTNEKYRKEVYSTSNPNGEKYFQDRVILKDDEGNETYNALLTTLNLDKVYIIATGSSASASELVINSLEPYMDVIHVGDTTTGKNEFSNTLVDDPENGFFYARSRESNINPDNSWAIQPLTGRSANADGFYEYTEGLIPDIAIEEELGDFGVLGDSDERLLARTIQEITGLSSKKSFNSENPINGLTNNRMFLPTRDNMYEGDILLTTKIK